MKPTCKAEADYAIWRPDNPRLWYRGFGKYAKRQMNRARRRQWKRERMTIRHVDV